MLDSGAHIGVHIRRKGQINKDVSATRQGFGVGHSAAELVVQDASNTNVACTCVQRTMKITVRCLTT
eukprot:1040416-Alexandrium_andersonii.AAC.2